MDGGQRHRGLCRRLVLRTHRAGGEGEGRGGGQQETKSGEREFSKDAAIDYDELILTWMDHYLRGIDNGVDKVSAVRYFAMGKNEWRESDSWPPPMKATP